MLVENTSMLCAVKQENLMWKVDNVWNLQNEVIFSLWNHLKDSMRGIIGSKSLHRPIHKVFNIDVISPHT